MNPVFLASALMQRVRTAERAETAARAGDRGKAVLFSTHAQLAQLVENDLKQGVASSVLVSEPDDRSESG